MTKILNFWTWISLRPVDQSSSNFMCSITGVRKGCIMFWGWLDQNSGVHGNRKPPLTYNGENGVSTFSRLFLIRSFLYLQDEFEFRPYRTTDYGVSCPWVSKRFPIDFHGNREPPLTYNGENDVSTFSQLFLIWSFLYLQVTRTCIKSWASSDFSQVWPLTTELAALERLKTFP